MSPSSPDREWSPCSVQSHRADGWTVLVVRGELDVQSAPVVRDAAVGSRPLVIDLSGCTFLDAAGLRVLAEAAATRPPGTVRITRPDRFRAELLRRCGFAHLLDVPPGPGPNARPLTPHPTPRCDP